jgi:hypothetical protein
VQEFADQFQPFGADVRRHQLKAGQVAAWACQAIDQPLADGIVCQKDDRSKLTDFARCSSSGSAYGNYHISFLSGQVL